MDYFKITSYHDNWLEGPDWKQRLCEYKARFWRCICTFLETINKTTECLLKTPGFRDICEPGTSGIWRRTLKNRWQQVPWDTLSGTSKIQMWRSVASDLHSKLVFDAELHFPNTRLAVGKNRVQCSQCLRAFSLDLTRDALIVRNKTLVGCNYGNNKTHRCGRWRLKCSTVSWS